MTDLVPVAGPASEVEQCGPARRCAHPNCYQEIDDDGAMLWECAACGETWETFR